MGNIQVLDEALINKIAAGEVIERPSSVVKEFVENAIDAGATRIAVELKEGGISYIKVADNGSGMDASDAKLCWERHATSKIASTDDLFSIDTLGFRGEALASIAAVSRMTLTTKREQDTAGVKLTIEGGTLKNEETVGCPSGTILEVSDLFYNTPARKKYLKAFATELSHTLDVVTRYALIHPHIHFSVTHNGRQSLNAPATDMKNNLVAIFGVEVAREMIAVSYENDGIRVAGYIAKPAMTRSDRSSQSIFVNGRAVRNKVISDAVYDAYNTLLMVNRHPILVLDVHVDPQQVDVNVHPQKQQIRLQQEARVREAVYAAVRESLINIGLIRDVREDTINTDRIFPQQRQAKIDGTLVAGSRMPRPVSTKSKAISATTRTYPVTNDRQDMLEGSFIARDAPAEEPAPQIPLPKFNPLGQVNRTYIVAEVEGGMYIIDQHAAEERVFFERYLAAAKAGKPLSQTVLSPIQLELPPRDATLLADNLETFTKLGFSIEEFGNNSFIVRSVPVFMNAVLGKEDVTDILDDLIKNIAAGGSALSSLESRREEIIASMSCRAAIKAGKQLTQKEIHDLVAELLGSENPFSCPHGRPVIVNLSTKELEKMFKRVV